MTHNMTIADRIIRVIIAVTITGLYIFGLITGIWGIVLMFLSFVFLITSFVNFCPLYKLLGIKRWEKISRGTEIK
jgi:hypothetical protein